MKESDPQLTSKMRTILRKWINATNRKNSGYTKFTVVDIEENRSPDKEILKELSKMMVLSRTSPTLLISAAESLGWEKVKAIFGASLQPSFNALKKGNFGEALTSALAEIFFDYIVPVQKFRYAILRSDSLHGIDNIMLKHINGKISEICFSESKLRTGTSRKEAVEAYVQLETELKNEVPPMIKFVAERLIEMNSPIKDAFLEYMFDRQQVEDKETFLISLIWDIDTWHEDVLENLEKHRDSMERVTNVTVVQLSKLEELTNSVFALINDMEPIEDV